jgi:acetolactate synthase small subunit
VRGRNHRPQGFPRITIVTKANPPVVEQIEKQLNKLINVIKVRDLTGPARSSAKWR